MASRIRSSSHPAPRFVAMLDVLGFKNALDSEPLDNLAARYRQFTIAVESLSKWEIRTVVFSDTVMVYSAPLEREVIEGQARSLAWRLNRNTAEIASGEYERAVAVQGELFLNWVAEILRTALRLGLPLRGGIAFGDCVINRSRQTFLGQAIVDAYLTESRQDWVGVALHDSMFDFVPRPVEESEVKQAVYVRQLDDERDRVEHLHWWPRLVRWPVPTKSGPSLEWTINWMQGVKAYLVTGRDAAPASLRHRWDAALDMHAFICEQVSPPRHDAWGPKYHAT